MVEFSIKIFPGIITAIIASYLASKWALKKFYSEKWWERKERAYVEIIDALYDLIQYCEIKREDYGQNTGHSKSKETEFAEKYNQGYWKIKKATDVSGLVLSSQAENILKELRNRPKLDWNENPSWEIYEQDYGYYIDALKKIIQVAKRDLNATR